MYKCKICGKNVSIFAAREDNLCKECALKDEKQIIKAKRKFIIFGIVAVFSTIFFIIGVYTFPEEIIGTVAYPGKELSVSIETIAKFLDGAVYAEGKGEFIIVNSGSELFKINSSLTAFSNDRRNRVTKIEIGQGTIAYPPKTGTIYANIVIPPCNISKPLYIEGYLLMPCEVAVLTSGGFYYAPMEVKSNAFKFTLLPTQRLPFALHFFFYACGLISLFGWIISMTYFSEYHKGLKLNKMKNADF